MKRYLFFGAAITLLLSSCVNEVQVTEYDNDLVALAVNAGIGETTTSEVITRSVKTGETFSTGETIGVFITGIGYTSSATVYTKATSANWTGDAINLTNNSATVYGYYPSSLSPTFDGSGTNHTVPAKVLTTLSTNGFDAAYDDATVLDYMYAVGTGTAQATVTKGAFTATMKFKHALAQLVFIIKKTDQFGGTGTLTNITLTQPSTPTQMYFKGGATEGTMKLTDGTLSLPSTSETTISLTDSKAINSSSTNTTTATVFVAPTNAKDIMLSLIIDEASYSLGSGIFLPTGPVGTPFTTWDAGMIYTYTINVGGGTLTLGDLTVDVKNWTAGPISDEVSVQ